MQCYLKKAIGICSVYDWPMNTIDINFLSVIKYFFHAHDLRYIQDMSKLRVFCSYNYMGWGGGGER